MGRSHFVRIRLAQKNNHPAKRWADLRDDSVASWLEQHQFAPIEGLPVFVQVQHGFDQLTAQGPDPEESETESKPAAPSRKDGGFQCGPL